MDKEPQPLGKLTLFLHEGLRVRPPYKRLRPWYCFLRISVGETSVETKPEVVLSASEFNFPIVDVSAEIRIKVYFVRFLGRKSCTGQIFLPLNVLFTRSASHSVLDVVRQSNSLTTFHDHHWCELFPPQLRELASAEHKIRGVGMKRPRHPLGFLRLETQIQLSKPVTRCYVNSAYPAHRVDDDSSPQKSTDSNSAVDDDEEEESKQGVDDEDDEEDDAVVQENENDEQKHREQDEADEQEEKNRSSSLSPHPGSAPYQLSPSPTGGQQSHHRWTPRALYTAYKQRKAERKQAKQAKQSESDLAHDITFSVSQLKLQARRVQRAFALKSAVADLADVFRWKRPILSACLGLLLLVLCQLGSSVLWLYPLVLAAVIWRHQQRAKVLRDIIMWRDEAQREDTLRERLLRARRVVLKVQIGMSLVADVAEKFANVWNWTDPALTSLAVAGSIGACVVLSLVLLILPVHHVAQLFVLAVFLPRCPWVSAVLERLGKRLRPRPSARPVRGPTATARLRGLWKRIPTELQAHHRLIAERGLTSLPLPGKSVGRPSKGADGSIRSPPESLILHSASGV